MTEEGEKFRELFLENILLLGVCEAKKNLHLSPLQTHITSAPAHVTPQKNIFQTRFTGANGSTVCIIAPGRNAGNSTYTDASG